LSAAVADKPDRWPGRPRFQPRSPPRRSTIAGCRCETTRFSAARAGA